MLRSMACRDPAYWVAADTHLDGLYADGRGLPIRVG